jgi:uncharacterized membrane protein
MTAAEERIDPETSQPAGEGETSEPVWTFRGYRLRASEFTTAMVHLFRAEIQRANAWRQRLDATTNWAVVTTGAAISFAFSREGNAHYVMAFNAMLVTMFLSIESRRYRYYELWSSRIRLMETDFFGAMLVPPFHPSGDWAEALADNLFHPHFPISIWEALGRRLRRNYLVIYAILGVAWLAQLMLQPAPAATFQEVVQRAAVGPISGSWVMLLALSFGLILLLVGLGTIGLQEASGEVLPRYPILQEAGNLVGEGLHRSWFRHSGRRTQLLTLIITDKSNEVTQLILKEMRRGVTALAGTGMFTGKPHPVLMCALTTTEVPQLKALVAQADDSAFVIVAPAQEILGKGFIPLHEE